MKRFVAIQIKIRMKNKEIKEDIRKGYDIISRSFCHTRNYLWREMRSLKDLVKEGEVLDLGCGNGRLYELFADNPKISYTGIDFSKRLIEYAKSRYLENFKGSGPKPKFVVADMLNYELGIKNYEGIFLIASYHHIPEKKERLELLKRVHDELKDDGIVVLTIWNLWSNKTMKKVIQSWWRKILRQEKGGLFDIFYPFNDNGKIIYRYYHMFTKWSIERELKRYFKIIRKEKWQKGQNLVFYLRKK